MEQVLVLVEALHLLLVVLVRMAIIKQEQLQALVLVLEQAEMPLLSSTGNITNSTTIIHKLCNNGRSKSNW